MIALIIMEMKFGKFTLKSILFFGTLLIPSTVFAQLCPENRSRIGEVEYTLGHWGAFVPRDKHIAYPVEKYKACFNPKLRKCLSRCLD